MQKSAASYLINIAIVITAVILFCVAGEFFARMYVPPSIRMTREAFSYFNMMDYDEDIGGRVLKKNYNGKVFFRFGNDFTVKTNSLGLRNPELSSKSGDDHRVLFVGDSFTMGYGVEQDHAFPDIVRGLFSKVRRDKKIDVVNGGVTGWGTVQIQNFLKKNITKIAPDTVIYALYINDFYDTFRYKTHTNRDVFLENWRRQKKDVEEYMSKRSFLHAGHFFLSDYSYFYEFLSDRVQTTLDNWEMSRLASNHWLSVGRIGVHNYEPWPAGPQGAAVIDLSKTLPNGMKVQSWKVMSLADADELTLIVWYFDPSDSKWKVRGKSTPQSASFGMNTFVIDPPVEARKGDVLGFFTKAGSIARLHPLDNMPRMYRNAQAEDESVAFITDGSGNYCMRIDGPSAPELPSEPIVKPLESESAPNLTVKVKDVPQVDEGDIAKGELELLKPQYNQTTKTAYEQTLKIVSEMSAFVQSNGASFYVVNIPSSVEVGKELEGQPAAVAIDGSPAGSPSFDERLQADLSSLGVNYISIKSPLKENPVRVLYLSDSHLNQKGHEVVGQAIYEAFSPKLSKVLSQK